MTSHIKAPLYAQSRRILLRVGVTLGRRFSLRRWPRLLMKGLQRGIVRRRSGPAPTNLTEIRFIMTDSKLVRAGLHAPSLYAAVSCLLFFFHQYARGSLAHLLRLNRPASSCVRHRSSNGKTCRHSRAKCVGGSKAVLKLLRARGDSVGTRLSLLRFCGEAGRRVETKTAVTVAFLEIQLKSSMHHPLAKPIFSSTSCGEMGDQNIYDNI